MGVDLNGLAATLPTVNSAMRANAIAEEMAQGERVAAAITRARKKLKIYWTPETQHKVLTEMEPISCKRDAFIISNKHNIPIANRNG